MEINYDITIQTEESEIDLKAGIETIEGAAETTRCIIETIASQHVPQRQSSKSNVRAKLKHTFKGSYGLRFSIEINDLHDQKSIRKIKKETVAELTTYFINEALYKESNELTDEAKVIIEKLEQNSELLVSQLRVSSLAKLHKVARLFNQNIKLRQIKSHSEKFILGEFTRDSSHILDAKATKESLIISAGITRFNIYTGNGRLLPKDSNETVAFGFKSNYKDIKMKTKKIFSENLDYNNGLDSEKMKNINLEVTPIKVHNDKVVKYIINKIIKNA